MVVGRGPFDERLMEQAGRVLPVGPDYIHYCNILYEMGVRANVASIGENHRNGWGTHEEALEDQRWMFHGMTSEEEEKVKDYLRRHLIYQDGQWRLPYERKCYWAVMWWAKQYMSAYK